jgi:hypothetical protein
MESCALCTPIKDDLGFVILGKVIVGTQQNLVEWSPSKSKYIFFHLEMDEYKEHVVSSTNVEVTSPTKLGSFCLHWKMAFTYLNAEMLSWSPSNWLHISLTLPTKGKLSFYCNVCHNKHHILYNCNGWNHKVYFIHNVSPRTTSGFLCEKNHILFVEWLQQMWWCFWFIAIGQSIVIVAWSLSPIFSNSLAVGGCLAVVAVKVEMLNELFHLL